VYSYYGFIGGVRASIYNALPEEDIDTLIQYMIEFERNHTTAA
jgi:phosphoserine aminotransferase